MSLSMTPFPQSTWSPFLRRVCRVNSAQVSSFSVLVSENHPNPSRGALVSRATRQNAMVISVYFGANRLLELGVREFCRTSNEFGVLYQEIDVLCH